MSRDEICDARAPAGKVRRTMSPANVQEYVCGFLFSPDRTRVLLIRKNRPAWQAGKLNGLGGKIEPGETPLEAMRREFREEAGAEVADWQHVLTLSGADDAGSGRGWAGHFFRAFGDLSGVRGDDRRAAGGSPDANAPAGHDPEPAVDDPADARRRAGGEAVRGARDRTGADERDRPHGELCLSTDRWESRGTGIVFCGRPQVPPDHVLGNPPGDGSHVAPPGQLRARRTPLPSACTVPLPSRAGRPRRRVRRSRGSSRRRVAVARGRLVGRVV